jgi:hypothetical protein
VDSCREPLTSRPARPGTVRWRRADQRRGC